MTQSIAFFISPHGYGHAARSCAIMAALHELNAAIRFEIFTTVPPVFFHESLTGAFGYHSVATDIGLAQLSPLDHDFAATLQRLDEFLPFSRNRTEQLARQVTELKCSLILCDIAPLGIAVAQAAGLPSVLIENFTWDWIYQGFTGLPGRWQQHIESLAETFRSADYRIQLEPVCQRDPTIPLIRPVSRKPRTSAGEIRKQLSIPENARLVLITMGGIPPRYGFLERWDTLEGVYFVIPGASETLKVNGNLVLLPHHSQFFHPDLVNAADALIGKVGYSTLAEVYHAGIPFGYVTRPDFRESGILVAYLQEHLSGLAIDAREFEAGAWLTRVPELLGLPRVQRSGENGAVQAAKLIRELLMLPAQPSSASPGAAWWPPG